MYLLKKQVILSPSIPRRILNFKNSKTLKNDVPEFSSSRLGSSTDYESEENAESAGTSDEWTDLEETLKESSTLDSSLDDVVIPSSRLLHDIDSDSFGRYNHIVPIASSTPKSSFVEDEKESSGDFSPVEQVRFSDSFDDFAYGEPLVAAETYSPKALFAEDGKGSSSDYSPVEQARFADSFDFNFGVPIEASTPCSPNALLVKDGREILPEGAKYWNSFERNFENESSKRSLSSQKLPEKTAAFVEDQINSFYFNFDAPLTASTLCSPNSSFVKDARDLDDFECFQFNEPSTASSPLYKKTSFLKQNNDLDDFDCYKFNEPSTAASHLYKRTSFLKQNNDMLPETPMYRSSFKRSFKKQFSKCSRGTQKEPSKNSCATQKEIFPEKVPKRRLKFVKRKLYYSGYLLSDKKSKISKGTSIQVSDVKPTKKILSRCEGNICPLGSDLVPGPKWSPPSPFFGCDVPIDDIYILMNGRNLKSKKRRTKRSRKNKSKEK